MTPFSLLCFPLRLLLFLFSLFDSLSLIVLHIIPLSQNMYLMANRPYISHRAWLNKEKYPVRKILILWTVKNSKKRAAPKNPEQPVE